MNSNNNYDDVVFMSPGQFEYLSDTESFVFAHITFFASQMRPYKRQFKQTTQAICNKIGYSPNAVREAISSLIEKGFLKKCQALEEEEGSFHPYYDKISHRLHVGEHDYARLFARELEKTLITSKNKSKNSDGRAMTFFKVHVGQLKRNLSLLSGNSSKHVHKALILHGYLHNQHKWNVEKNRNSLQRTVPSLAKFLQWSQNTTRRVINTLKLWGIVDYKYTNGSVRFLTVRQFNTAAKTVTSLITKLCNVVQTKDHTEIVSSPEQYDRSPKSPQEATKYLQKLKSLGKI
ncbi:hypothetical protein KUL152_30540 [Tenacibaculum sp. KUL152]|nr:hypothetical protein KUL106_19160 [Alteromonas sp. KUL106]GFD79431.1 hypothetical protein KUL118_22930 [Tenacibaculum sp. KUL118]GFD90828.1 hypothetical protein KUL152_30540 [Tenacibaculum sp. KUL152]GFD94501.1 hypothetical protein KUL154_32340 [Alteromonas sp. KUL154]GFE01329.1 hypothetical protein KUL156_39210 [Alteromonas sp. KUL156]